MVKYQLAMFSGVSLSLLAALFIAGAGQAADQPDCSRINPGAAPASAVRRPVVADDLIRLRDIGPTQRPAQENYIGLSPDGKRLAFFMTQADPAANAYCRALVVLRIARPGSASLVDLGGDPIYELVQARGTFIDYGYPALDRPAWSPDGQWIAYLRRDVGRTQLWRARSDGRGAEQVTHSTSDIEQYAWTADGTALIFAARPGLVDARRALETEGRKGFLYDARTVPYTDRLPGISSPIPLAYFVIDPANEALRPANAAEKQLVAPPPPAASAAFALKSVAEPGGSIAWTQQSDPGRYMSAINLFAKDRSGKVAQCLADVCDGTQQNNIIGLWWAPRAAAVVFERRSGPAYSRTAFYRWRIGSPKAVRILESDDLFASCQADGGELICAREGSVRPRRIVDIDMNTGRAKTLFDPNPEFAQLTVGRVQRLIWSNKFGLSSFGDLVIPSDYKPGQKLPLIVVQYRTRGFLRGGTGDEYPIQLFAAHGFAVLSVESPPPYYTSIPNGPWRDVEEAEQENIRDFHERESNLSSLMTGVQQVIDAGIADPKRIGITGLSDGSTTVQFALVNTSSFAAASMSSGGTDSQSMIYGGAALAKEREFDGYPSPINPDRSFWRRSSLAFKDTGPVIPILMQVSDHESLLMLETYTMLRDRHWPVELYTFPNEYHLKSEPAHREAIYARNLDWFEYWLNGKRSDDPAKTSQYERWDALKVHAAATGMFAADPASTARAQTSTSTNDMIRPQMDDERGR